ncbi:MAG: hypothetical protein IJH40_02865 [Ruminococcus sp.]|uniref:hypothetical protein n=1 Tax=Ruminococcus sp. TaxID=41978 RepID=UPI002872ED24|nr:hypothetical protein [Ruminococcus sp.]MBQ3284559.1 hypothetical protein [Ruminococcus sp.]
MLNEIEEFKAYTQFPKYNANGKRDMSFLGRFTFDMLIKQIGLHRVLTNIARGYMYATDTPDIERTRCALQAWCSLPTEKKDDWKANTNFSELYDIFPELVDKDGCGWFYRHVHNICDFVKCDPDSVSKTAIKKCDTLKKGFDKEWEKKVIRFQVPIFSSSTKGSWILRFDDILADALELGKLKNNDFSLPDGIKDYIQKNVLTSSARSAELLVKYYIVNKPDDTDKVVLPITNIDAYFGNGNFSKKWLPKELDSVIIRDPQSNGVSRYSLHEKLKQLL